MDAYYFIDILSRVELLIFNKSYTVMVPSLLPELEKLFFLLLTNDIKKNSIEIIVDFKSRLYSYFTFLSNDLVELVNIKKQIFHIPNIKGLAEYINKQLIIKI